MSLVALWLWAAGFCVVVLAALYSVAFFVTDGYAGVLAGGGR